MQCSIHQGREASGTCSVCNRFLCYECASLFNPPTCANCAIEMGKEASNKLILRIVLSVIFAGIGGFIAYSIWTIGVALIIGLLCMGLPWGFAATPIVTGGVFALKGCWVGMFFVIGKLIGASVVGVFVMPFQIVKLARQIRLSKSAYTLFE